MLKILWFSNSPALAFEYLSKETKIKGTGGWMGALNDIMKDQVDLSIAFHYPYKKNNFEYKNTTYYPIYNGNIYFELLRSRFLIPHNVDRYLHDYLDIIHSVQPDIIHIHGTENEFLAVLKFVKIPIVVSIQGNITVCNHKFFVGFYGKYLNRSKFSNLKEFLLGPKSFKKSKILLSRMAMTEGGRMRNIPYIIGRTKWDYRITRVLSPNSRYFQGEELLRESFYRHIWDNPYKNGKLIIFTTNGDSYYKGIESVFHAITLLQSVGIDVEWRIAGINENSLIKSISKSFLGADFPNFGYQLLGSLDEQQLVQELLNSHLYVMPSHIENSPNNLCEAMILGMPCIATFVGGTGSLLNDGEDGILIQDGDPWAMAGAVIELLNDVDRAKQYGKNARQKALLRHDKRTVSDQYLNIYKSILSQSIIGN